MAAGVYCGTPFTSGGFWNALHSENSASSRSWPPAAAARACACAFNPLKTLATTTAPSPARASGLIMSVLAVSRDDTCRRIIAQNVRSFRLLRGQSGARRVPFQRGVLAFEVSSNDGDEQREQPVPHPLSHAAQRFELPRVV